ncbi:MAG: hypothetical protein WC381_09810 [Kiritimatiellia bacterium]|jgi:hypothetical protein
MNDEKQSVSRSTSDVIRGQRVFTYGHSFHAWVAPILAELAKSAGIAGHAIAGRAEVGGSAGAPPYLNHHWNIPDEENATKKALRAGRVDVLTLSPIWLPDPGIEKFAELALEHNPGARVTVQEFWLPNDIYDTSYPLNTRKPVNHNDAKIAELRVRHQPYFQSVEDNVRQVNRHLGRSVVFVVPVGHAVLALRAKIIAGQARPLEEQEDLFNDSWGHPRPPLQALAAYCHFAAIYRRSPVGLPAPSRDVCANVWPEKRPWRDDALNRLFQELAWDAVIQHPLSGVP